MVAPGQVLSHFRLIKEIGSGGMGVVYRAHDEHLERDVAVKVLSAGLLTDTNARTRFRREALALSKLNHPNIATVHDFDSVEDTDFLVMEYVPGAELSVKLSAGALEEHEIVRLGGQLLDGLAVAHEQGIVHRDLKPGNVRITEEGRLKILDFGLAKLLIPAGETATTQTQTRGVVGTMPYMAPEQVNEGPVDARTDLYAAGSVLYEMATGRRPFTQGETGKLLYAIVHESPPSPSTINSSVSPDLEALVLKALAKDPAERYQSARELARDLERLGAGVAVTAPRRRTGRVRRWLPGFAGLLVAAITILLALDVGGVRSRWVGGAVRQRIESLAVLPLENLSADPAQEYFADGMTEALITDLGRNMELRVISRRSVMQFKGVAKPLSEIGRELNVDGVVEGSVLREGDRLRLSVRLIDASSDEQIWVDSYERDLRDVLGLQRELARTIAEKIHLKLTPSLRAELAYTDSIDPAAYETYLKGRYHLSNTSTAQGFQKALQLFDAVIEKEPRYAPAYAGAGTCYNLLAGFSDLSPAEGYERARALASRALELDERLAEAHGVLAVVASEYDWDWNTADQHYRRALELNPNYADVRVEYAWYLHMIGRPESALAQARLALEFDPLSLPAGVMVGQALFGAGHNDEAIEQLRGVLELDSHFGRAYQVLARVYEREGMFEEAITAMTRAVEFSGERLLYKSWLARLRGLAGDKTEASRMLDELTERSRTDYVSPVNFALVYIGLGESERAIDWLDRAYQERSIHMVILRQSVLYDPLRSEPRFQELVRRMDFPSN